ncbi:MAG: ATP-dependent DNA helicase RecG [Bacilli bacterium]|nr:ATP-dependent DNA helicase RecG [Bacilli bacterium]
MINDVKGIGESTKKILQKLGISTIQDLLSFYPFRYDVLKRTDLLYIEKEDKAIIDGMVESTASVYYINKKLNKMTFRMRTGNLLVTVYIFNRAFLKNKLLPGTEITVIGKYNPRNNSLTATDIRFSLLEEIPKIEPVYHTVYGISTKKIETIIGKALEQELDIEDFIPQIYKEKYHFLDKEDSIRELHKPSAIETLKRARARTKYEELFVFMMKMQYLKNNQASKIGFTRDIDKEKVNAFLKELPFTLTKDQMSSVKEIYEDLSKEKRMNRMLQGDVGSGKTIVALIAMYMNFLSGYQSALMAPTEILAVQHYKNMKKLFAGKGIQIALLTGKLKAKEKKDIYKELENGSIHMVVGTHALISEAVTYQNLGLVITDEQHRFGVRQRSTLKNKGMTPDILYMSATPIPRTYALTLYGDMDVSNIKTRPSGRKDIITKVYKEKEMKQVLEKMYEELLNGHQIYVIAPLIEESEKLDLENTDALKEKMEKAFGKKYNIGVLHGKMSNEEKESTMKAFEQNEVQILISTTVVEVGVDVANATMIVIFDAYRFGLSTLHQLRGRVGRNDLQSHCILISNYEKERLHIMEQTNDGFMVSEEDFKLRGSGDLFGQKQSGDMRFALADIKKDFSILLRAKEDSTLYLENNIEDSLTKKILENVQNLS